MVPEIRKRTLTAGGSCARSLVISNASLVGRIRGPHRWGLVGISVIPHVVAKPTRGRTEGATGHMHFSSAARGESLRCDNNAAAEPPARKAERASAGGQKLGSA
jgi:hypothetical protein